MEEWLAMDGGEARDGWRLRSLSLQKSMG
jgi:hypothetical protein